MCCLNLEAGPGFPTLTSDKHVYVKCPQRPVSKDGLVPTPVTGREQQNTARVTPLCHWVQPADKLFPIEITIDIQVPTVGRRSQTVQPWKGSSIGSYSQLPPQLPQSVSDGFWWFILVWWHHLCLLLIFFLLLGSSTQPGSLSTKAASWLL